ncbi:HAD-IA family hydrolase [Candidatus Pacearchaeota archaeon]|nr:HAD-IA family hydrolase [Candidatus Pacearchaeota archaeon]
MEKIKVIFFDWGGVLIKFPPHQTVKYWAKYLGIDHNSLLSFYERHKKKLWKGTWSQDFFWRRVSKKLKISFPKRRTLFEDAFSEAYKENKNIFSIAKNLYKKGYKLVLITNSEIPATNYFKRKNYNIFSKIFVSININMIKTEKQFYKYLLKKLKVRSEEALLVDDKTYCTSIAKSVGINTILFKNGRQLKRDLKKLVIK